MALALAEMMSVQLEEDDVGLLADELNKYEALLHWIEDLTWVVNDGDPTKALGGLDQWAKDMKNEVKVAREALKRVRTQVNEELERLQVPS